MPLGPMGGSDLVRLVVSTCMVRDSSIISAVARTWLCGKKQKQNNKHKKKTVCHSCYSSIISAVARTWLCGSKKNHIIKEGNTAET